MFPHRWLNTAWNKRWLVLTLALFLFSSMGVLFAARQKHQAPRTEPPPQQAPVVQVAMRNVVYHYTDTIFIEIRRLQGELLPTQLGAIPWFDDRDSFLINITSAEVAISDSVMTHLLNERVFNAPDAPMKEVEVMAGEGTITVKGKLRHKLGLRFKTEGTLSATPSGEIMIQPNKIAAGPFRVKGLMHLFNIHIGDLVNLNTVRGLRAEGNDLVITPEEILPPPRIHGRVAEVHVAGHQIVQVFDGTASRLAEGQEGNYMNYHGSQLRFGKLTMSDADLMLIDMDPQDPFDFYLSHYREQLTAGYTRITPEFGLRTYMRDYNKLSPPVRKEGA